MKSLNNTILIIGAARSGTKMLGNVFKIHPQVSYLSEINYIWRIGNANYKSDQLDEKLVSEKIKNKIIKKLLFFIKPCTVLVEKTTANSLRLPFIMKILPKAKILHIVRDGRDVTLSASKKWQNKFSDFEIKHFKYENINREIIKEIKYRIKSKIIPLNELYHYIPKIKRILKKIFTNNKISIWGPLFPGIEEMYKKYTLLEVCAYQWLYSINSIINFKNNNPKIPFYEVKYEDICKNPEKELLKIFQFCKLSKPENWLEMIDVIKNGNSLKWEKELNKKEIENIQKILQEKLKYFGYE